MTKELNNPEEFARKRENLLDTIRSCSNELDNLDNRELENEQAREALKKTIRTDYNNAVEEVTPGGDYSYLSN